MVPTTVNWIILHQLIIRTLLPRHAHNLTWATPQLRLLLSDGFRFLIKLTIETNQENHEGGIKVIQAKRDSPKGTMFLRYRISARITVGGISVEHHSGEQAMLKSVSLCLSYKRSPWITRPHPNPGRWHHLVGWGVAALSRLEGATWLYVHVLMCSWNRKPLGEQWMLYKNRTRPCSESILNVAGWREEFYPL